MSRFRLTLILTAVYFAIITLAVVVAVMSNIVMTDLAAVLMALLPYQLAAAIVSLTAVYFAGGRLLNGFGRIRLRALVWLMPSWIVLVLMFVNITKHAGGAPLLPLHGWSLLLLLGVPFLIAVGEEVMFRGVLLRQALTRMSVTRAMLLSAVLFALLHLVNGILGQGFSNAVQHVAFAFLVGFSLAPIALRMGNIWPLIIWHWLWNVAVFTSQAADVLQPLVLIGIAIQVAVSGWLWRDLAASGRA